MAGVSSAKVTRVTVIGDKQVSDPAPDGAATWVHVPVLENPVPVKEMGIDEATEGNDYGAATAPLPTAPKATLAMTTRVYGGSKTFDGSGGSSDPTTCFAQALLESYFGAARDITFTSTTIEAASGPGKTTPLKVLSAASMVVGGAIQHQTTKEIAFITAINTTATPDEVTLDRDFTTYTAAGVVGGAFNFSPAIGDAASSAKLIYVNHERDSHKSLLGEGAVFGFQLQGLAANSSLQYAFNAEFDDWQAGVTLSNFTRNAFTTANLVSKGGKVLVNGTESICISDGSLDFGVGHEWVECASGTNGRDGVAYVSAMPTASFTEYYSSTRWDDYRAQTGKTFHMSFANSGYQAVAVFFPNATFTVAEGAIGSKEGYPVTVRANMPTAAQVTAGLTKPVYYAVFSGE